MSSAFCFEDCADFVTDEVVVPTENSVEAVSYTSIENSVGFTDENEVENTVRKVQEYFSLIRSIPVVDQVVCCPSF